jgi:HSP20 family molecular chaperone IbpA
MSQSAFFSTLRSSDHDVIAALRFLDDFARHVHERGHHHQIYRNFVPRFDLEQHSDSYHLYGELPGFRREDITIEANDGHNLQVSGSISPIKAQPPPSTKSKGTEAGEPLNTQPDSDPLERTTTNEERYLNARFGDVLNRHPDSAGAQDPAEANPEAPEGSSGVRSLISERNSCSFHRAFHFPTPIKRDQVTATMQDGILHITAPRAPMPPPVKVQVRNELEYYPALVV